MRVEPLEAPFGARLFLESDSPLSQEERAAFRSAFGRHGLLVVRDAGAIPAERQIELLSALGRIEPDRSGRPMQMEVTNQHASSSAPPGELVFHCDYAYDPAPIPAISMYGERVAEGATPTLFANAATVLERLPRELVLRLRSARVANACFLHRLDAPGVRSHEPDPILPRGDPGWGPEHYWTHHPAIVRNAHGVDALFACLQHTDRLVGMERSESDDMLAELYAALYAPEEIYAHAWREGDLVFWDNWIVQHARPEPNERPRHLRRFHVSPTDLTEEYLRVGRAHGLL